VIAIKLLTFTINLRNQNNYIERLNVDDNAKHILTF